MEKSEIRRQIKALKRLLTEEQRQEAALKAFAMVELLPEFIAAKHVLVYYSLPDELPTPAFIQKWHCSKQLYLPRVNGDDLDILPYDPADLETGSFNISEPQGSETVNPDVIDLIIVPAVAYDRQGNRIGRGKGFYDRLLCRARAVKVGICYNCQICENFEPSKFDVPVDYVISDEEKLCTHNGCVLNAQGLTADQIKRIETFGHRIRVLTNLVEGFEE